MAGTDRVARIVVPLTHVHPFASETFSNVMALLPASSPAVFLACAVGAAVLAILACCALNVSRRVAFSWLRVSRRLRALEQHVRERLGEGFSNTYAMFSRCGLTPAGMLCSHRWDRRTAPST